jgi:hypothetical protein
MSVWQGVAMDSPKYHYGLAMLDFSMPCGPATPETASCACGDLEEDFPYIRVYLHRFAWNAVGKISFDAHRFSVLPKDDSSGDVKGGKAKHRDIKLNFYSDSTKKSKYLMKLVQSQQRFQVT